MKIIKRLAEKQYCYHEIHFDSLKEYKSDYPKFIQAYIDMQTEIQDLKDNQPPFDGSRPADKQIDVKNV